MPRRRFRTRRSRRTRYRRRTFRSRYPRGRLYTRRSLSNHTLTGLVKRLYRINEIRQVRSDYAFNFSPSTVQLLGYNSAVHPIAFPVPLSTGIAGLTDSTFEGNTFQPVALKVRLQLSMNSWRNSSTTEIDPSNTYGGWVRMIVYQVKAGNASNGSVTSSLYHELAGQAEFNLDSTTVKRRILGSPAPSTITNLFTNYHNEPTSPLRVGIRGICRILADKRWSFSSNGKSALALRMRTRKPSQVKYVESPSGVQDTEPIDIPSTPSNQVYVMYIVTFDQWTAQQVVNNTAYPTMMLSANYELVYRDA